MKQSEYMYYLNFPIFQRIYKEKAKIKKISPVYCDCYEDIKQNVQKQKISKRPWNIPRPLFLSSYRHSISYIIINKLI